MNFIAPFVGRLHRAWNGSSHCVLTQREWNEMTGLSEVFHSFDCQVFHVLRSWHACLEHRVQSFFQTLAQTWNSCCRFQELWRDSTPKDDMEMEGPTCLCFVASKLRNDVPKHTFSVWSILVFEVPSLDLLGLLRWLDIQRASNQDGQDIFHQSSELQSNCHWV